MGAGEQVLPGMDESRTREIDLEESRGDVFPFYYFFGCPMFLSVFEIMKYVTRECC